MPYDPEITAALERIFSADSSIYQERGFQRRVGFGERPALIHIDLANAWTRPGHAFSCEGMDVIIPAVQRLNTAARAKGCPIVYTTTAYQVPEGPTSDTGLWHLKIPVELLRAGTPEAAIDDRIAPADGDLVLVKKRASGFHGTNLTSYLNALGVDTVIITGVTMAGCVRHTDGGRDRRGLPPHRGARGGGRPRAGRHGVEPVRHRRQVRRRRVGRPRGRVPRGHRALREPGRRRGGGADASGDARKEHVRRPGGRPRASNGARAQTSTIDLRRPRSDRMFAFPETCSSDAARRGGCPTRDRASSVPLRRCRTRAPPGDQYDWRRCEEQLKALRSRTETTGSDIHFVHVRSKHEDRCRSPSRTDGRARSSSAEGHRPSSPIRLPSARRSGRIDR